MWGGGGGGGIVETDSVLRDAAERTALEKKNRSGEGPGNELRRPK